MNYITGGSGFLGTNLLKKVRATRVPHKSIITANYKPFDYFYYLSTYGNMEYHKGSWEMMRANVMDLIYVLEHTKHIDYRSFVFISTSSVKLKRQTVYSRAKKAAEEILLSYMERYDLPICIIRPYSITGRGEQEQHLIPTLIRSCREGELMNFVKEPTHDFINVEDVVDGIINLSENRARGIFELGTGTSYSNDQIRILVEKATGKKANVNIVRGLRDYDTDNWVSNNFRSRSFGWQPKKSISDSIKEML
jgi:UDP-glucose 4-epimerase